MFRRLAPMIEFAVLGSGSSGNSAVVCHGETRVLVDAGLSARQLANRLSSVGVDPDSLDAILLTHEHGDHVQGLEVFCRKREIPVYATVHTSHLVEESRIEKASIAWRRFEAGSTFTIGDLEIESFNVPHDAVDPVGFVFRGVSDSLGFLSDVGHVTRLIVDRLRGLDSLFVESNYDLEMLHNDSRRPWSLKQRISNRHGHLSNEQTADLLREVAGPGLHRVVLGHLSSDCNTAEKAIAFARGALQEMGLDHVEVECAGRSKPLGPRRVSEAAVAQASAAMAAAVDAGIDALTPAVRRPALLVEAKSGSARLREAPPAQEKPAKRVELCESSAPSGFEQMELAL